MPGEEATLQSSKWLLGKALCLNLYVVLFTQEEGAPPPFSREQRMNQIELANRGQFSWISNLLLRLEEFFMKGWW